MADIVLDSIGSGYNLSKFNANFSEIQRVINQELLHLHGGNNTMRQDLDMNSQRIINLPDGLSATEPVTVKQLESVAGELAGKSSLPYQVPPFSGTLISLPSAVFYVDVIIDGRMLPPDEFTFVQGNTFITLHEPVDSTQKVVVHRTGLTAGEVAPTTSIAVEIEEYIVAEGSVTDGINAAVAVARSNGKALVGKYADKTYILTDPVDLDGIDLIDFDCKFDTTLLDNTEDYAMLIGGLAETDNGGLFKFGEFISANPTFANDMTVKPQLRISGLKGCRLLFDNIRYLQLYVNDGVEYDSIAYNNFQFYGRYNIEFDGVQSQVGDPRWINQNIFRDGRMYKCFIRDNGYPHNHNFFINTLLEDSQAEIRVERGVNNFWLKCRMENVSSGLGVYFGENTALNVIEKTWISSLRPREVVQSAYAGAPYTDLGLGNRYVRQQLNDMQFHSVINFDGSVPMLSCGLEQTQPSTSPVLGVLDNPFEQQGFQRAAVQPALNSSGLIRVQEPFKILAQSGMIPVVRGDVFAFDAHIESGFWRYLIKIYDSNGLPLDEAGALDIPSGSYQGNGVYASADRTSADRDNVGAQWPLSFDIDSSNVAYVYIAVATGSASDNVIKYLNCRYYETSEQRPFTASSIQDSPSAMHLPSVPTMGCLEAGASVMVGSRPYTNTFQLRTRTTILQVGGGSNIIVAQDTNTNPPGVISAGDLVGVELDSGETHWTTVSSYDSLTKTVGLSDAIPPANNVLPNSSVGFNRWTPESESPYEVLTSSVVAKTGQKYLIDSNLTLTLPDGVSGDIITVACSQGVTSGGGFVVLLYTGGIQYFNDSNVSVVSTNVELSGTNPFRAGSEGKDITLVNTGGRWEIKI